VQTTTYTHLITREPVRVAGKAAYALAALQGEAMRATMSDVSAVERLDTQGAVDASSDSCFAETLRELVAIRRCVWLARTTPSNREAFLRDAEARADRAIGLQREGIRLDDLEDEHRASARADAADSAHADRSVVARCDALLTGRPADPCGVVRAPMVDDDGCHIQFDPCAELGGHDRHVFEIARPVGLTP
jgi:hypothetical protein